MTSLLEKCPPEKNFSLILDSGAFSAWTKKVPIDLDLYIEFLKKYGPYVSHYVNLDVIPAEFGRKPSSAEVEDSAQKGWDNLKLMNKAGLNPIPVFHQGESLKWLIRMVEEGYDYIGISPANDRGTSQKSEWLDEVFDLITDSQGRALVKTHGFAVTAISLLVRFPWYSADSASWVRTAGYGCIYIPKQGRDGSYDYTITPYRIFVSDLSPTLKKGGLHYQQVPRETQKAIDVYLDSLQLGYDYSHLRSHYKGRDEVNIRYFSDLEKSLPPKIFDRSVLHRGFFNKTHDFKRDGGVMELNIVLATAFCDYRNAALTRAGNTKRLVSYYYHVQGKVNEEYIPRLVKYGVGKPFHRLPRTKLKIS